MLLTFLRSGRICDYCWLHWQRQRHSSMLLPLNLFVSTPPSCHATDGSSDERSAMMVEWDCYLIYQFYSPQFSIFSDTVSMQQIESFYNSFCCCCAIALSVCLALLLCVQSSKLHIIIVDSLDTFRDDKSFEHSRRISLYLLSFLVHLLRLLAFNFIHVKSLCRRNWHTNRNRSEFGARKFDFLIQIQLSSKRER